MTAFDGDATPGAAPDSAEERIRSRAYELYLARGAAAGADVDDWLAAEREVRVRDGGASASDQDAAMRVNGAPRRRNGRSSHRSASGETSLGAGYA
jgi:Protein of unknown function (DUF2934)